MSPSSLPKTTAASSFYTKRGRPPGTRTPGTVAPGTTAPGTAAPRTAAPRTTAPETAAPGTATSGTTATAIAATATAVAERTVPGFRRNVSNYFYKSVTECSASYVIRAC